MKYSDFTLAFMKEYAYIIYRFLYWNYVLQKNFFVSFVADVFRGNLFSINLSAAYSPADNWTV